MNGLYLALLLLLGCCCVSLVALLTSSSSVSPVLLCLALSLLCAMLRRASLKLISPSASASSAPPQPSPSSPHRRRRSKHSIRAHPYTNSASSCYISTSPSSTQQQLTPDSSTSTAPKTWNDTDSVPLAIQSPKEPIASQSSDPFQSDDASTFPALRDGRYQVLCTVQASLFGSVKLAVEQSTGRRLCIKISCLQRAALGVTTNGVKVEENVQREGQLLQYLHSAALKDETGKDGIVEFIEELRDELFYYLVLADAGSDLFVHLKRLPVLRPDLQLIECVPSMTEDEGRNLFRQLIDAVQFCHRQHVAINDLSLENVCIDSTGRIRLIDLGLAAIHPLSPHRPSSGTAHPPLPAESPSIDSFFPVVPLRDSGPLSGKLHYMSSEKFARQPHCAYSADLYACAVILYTLLTGRPPYSSPVASDYWWRIISSGRWTRMGRYAVDDLSDKERRGESVARELFGWLSVDVVELLDGMMKEEGQRWTWKQVNACEWLQSGKLA